MRPALFSDVLETSRGPGMLRDAETSEQLSQIDRGSRAKSRALRPQAGRIRPPCSCMRQN